VKTGHYFRLTAGLAAHREAASFTGPGWQLSVMRRPAWASFLTKATVTDMIHGTDEAMCRVITVGNGNCSQMDTSMPQPQVVWVGTLADACLSATTDGGARR